jgi:hypothetical protein
MCPRVRSPSGSCQIDCHSRFFQYPLTTLQLFSRNFTEWWLRVVCLKIGFCIGGLTRSFNFGPRKPFALFTVHITIIFRLVFRCSRRTLTVNNTSRIDPNEEVKTWRQCLRIFSVNLIDCAERINNEAPGVVPQPEEFRVVFVRTPHQLLNVEIRDFFLSWVGDCNV